MPPESEADMYPDGTVGTEAFQVIGSAMGLRL